MSKVISPHGLWRVFSIQGDEGERLVDIGTHYGYVDEIALALADRQGWSLRFERVEPLDMTPKRKSVVIEIDGVRQEVYGKTGEVNAYKQIFNGRPVEVRAADLYAGVEVSTQAKTVNEIRAMAFAKLTPEERAAIFYASGDDYE